MLGSSRDPVLAKPAAHGLRLSNQAQQPPAPLSSPGGSAHACLGTSLMKLGSEIKGHTSVIFQTKKERKVPSVTPGPTLNLPGTLPACQGAGAWGGTIPNADCSGLSIAQSGHLPLCYSCSCKLKRTLFLTCLPVCHSLPQINKRCSRKGYPSSLHTCRYLHSCLKQLSSSEEYQKTTF